jgi:uncharacterized membrane protein
MNKVEFLTALREKLQEELNDTQIHEHMHYYDSYITQEQQGGKDEMTIIAELGDPVLLARSIIDAGTTQYYDESTDATAIDEGTSHQGDQANHGFYTKKLPHWGCFGIVLVVIVIIIMISLVGVVLGALLRVVLPLIVILLIISLFRSGKK